MTKQTRADPSARPASAVAYLTNQYPAPSHSFIRREMHALEALGWTVHRFSHRRVGAPLVDAADQDEAKLTCVLLDLLRLRLLADICHWLRAKPARTIHTFAGALTRACKEKRRWFVHLGYFGLACVLSRRLQHLGFPHLHVHFGTNASDVAGLCNQLCDITYSMTWHGPHEYEEPNDLNLADKIAAAAFVVVVAETGRETMCRRFPSFAEKIETIHCGLDPLWFTLPTFTSPAAARLVCVARLDHQKNPLLLIDAAALLKARGIGFLLTIIGDGALRSQVERRIAQQGLEACVVLKGWGTQQEVITHLQHSKALVLSSRDEGLPVAVMESFAAGRPAIAPNVGSMRELVETGVTGWLIPAHDPVALADAMQACLNAVPEVLQALGANARERIQGYRSELSAHLLGAAFRRAATAGACNHAR